MSHSYANDFNTATQIYYQELKKHSKPISREREVELIQLARQDDIHARNTILTSNLRFVFDIAKRYKGYGTPLGDLISEGNLGLMRAIDKFDETRNIKFISYAVWWIKQAMQEFIKKNQKIDSVESSIEDECDSQESLRDKLFFDNDNEDNYQEDNEAFDVISEENNEEALNEYQKKLISQLLSKVDKRTQDIIKMYYGLDNQKAKTLKEIGAIFNISKERVRQICKRAFTLFRSEILQNNIDLTTY